jgi:predicted dehydrogenase
MPKTLLVGIIGTGGMAHAHADNLSKIPGVKLTSCFDVVPGRAQEFAAKKSVAMAAKDMDELIATCDAVSIVTPDRFHAAPAIAVLKAKKHLLCEKPLTVTLAEARKVLAAYDVAAKSGVIGMVNFSYRRSAAFQEAIKQCQAGKLGNLRHVNASYMQSWLTNDWTTEGASWRLQTAAGSGGVLGDLGCHILDLATAVSGPVKALRCTLRSFPKFHKGKEYTEWKGKALDANDTAVIELDFANGALGVVQTSRWVVGRGNTINVELSGHKGALRFDLDESYERLYNYRLGDKTNRPWPNAKDWQVTDLKKAPDVWERWIAAIRKGKCDQPDIARGAEIQAMLDAATRSAKNGKWLAVPETR